MTENRHTRRRIGGERSRAPVAFRMRVPHLLVGVLGLVAVMLQSFVVQTHIHVQQPAVRAQTAALITLAAASVADEASTATGAPVDNYPINRDPANCPLCKEAAHSGQYVSSASVLATLPFPVNVNFIVFREIAPSRFAASHTWRGRAPPLA